MQKLQPAMTAPYSEPQALQAAPENNPPLKQAVRFAVGQKDLARTQDLLGEAARINHVKPPEVTYTNIPNEAGDGEVTKIEIRVKPDQADGAYSPAYAHNVNRFFQTFEDWLSLEKIVQYGPAE